MKFVLILAAMLTLAGCSTLSGLVNAGAKANDAAAVAAETTICRGISIGAWIRHYGGDADKAKAWKVLCNDQVKALP